jgi:hypothetical protein
MGFAHILGHTKFIMCELGEVVVLLHIRANHKKASIKIPTTTTTPAILVHKHSQHYIYIFLYISLAKVIWCVVSTS